MFSTTDDGGRRRVRVFVSAPGRSEELTVPTSLAETARRASVLPDDHQLSQLANAVVDHERRQDRAVEAVRIEIWRIAYAADTLAATAHLLTDFVYRVDSTAPPSP
jgi:hypothetical protein